MSIMSEIEDGSTIMKGTEADKAAGLFIFSYYYYHIPQSYFTLSLHRFRQLFLLVCLSLSSKANVDGSRQNACISHSYYA